MAQSERRKGCRHSEETKKILSIKKIGKLNPLYGKHPANYIDGRSSKLSSYTQLHGWVRKNKGIPKECNFCGTQEGKIEWANISWEYKKDINDYMPLCVECHKGFDSNNIGAMNNFIGGFK